jgi:hypothetical protein
MLLHDDRVFPAVYLAADSASYVTGRILVVDWGTSGQRRQSVNLSCVIERAKKNFHIKQNLLACGALK